MIVEVSLVEQIEALSRPEFRASVNVKRRATLAIGALLLHWGQFETSLGSMIESMRKEHEALGLGGLPEEYPSDRGGRLKLLRKFIKACSSNPVRLAEFDKLRTRISRNTRIRNDLAHGAMSLGNIVSFKRGPDGILKLRQPLPERVEGIEAGVCLVCFRRQRKKDGMIMPDRFQIVAHLLSEIFEAADELYNDRGSLENLVSRCH
jgi:hypothetical protein